MMYVRSIESRRRYKKLAALLVMAILVAATLPALAFAEGAAIDLAKSEFNATEEIVISYSGITEQMYKDKAFIGFYEEGAAHSAYLWRGTPLSGSGSISYTAPATDGTYEFRLFSKYEGPSDATLVAKKTITVIRGAKRTPEPYSTVPSTTAEPTTEPETTSNDSLIDVEPTTTAAAAEEPTTTVATTEPATTAAAETTSAAPPVGESKQFEGASDWSIAELNEADERGLIPASLEGANMGEPINRREFAHFAVLLYEELTGTMADPAAENPFVDTDDPEVLKAYALGITIGTSDNEYEPYTVLDREQMATMLTRIYKAYAIKGWTIATDADFPLPYTRLAPFEDDANISDWAKESVYFMESKKVIVGTGDNYFSPNDPALREEAIAFALRMANNLKGEAWVAPEIEE